MWQYQDFSVTKILREIKFGESRKSKTQNTQNWFHVKILVIENHEISTLWYVDTIIISYSLDNVKSICIELMQHCPQSDPVNL